MYFAFSLSVFTPSMHKCILQPLILFEKCEFVYIFSIEKCDDI